MTQRASRRVERIGRPGRKLLENCGVLSEMVTIALQVKRPKYRRKPIQFQNFSSRLSHNCARSNRAPWFGARLPGGSTR